MGLSEMVWLFISFYHRFTDITSFNLPSHPKKKKKKSLEMNPISKIYGTKGVQLLSNSTRNVNPRVSLQNLCPYLVHKIDPLMSCVALVILTVNSSHCCSFWVAVMIYILPLNDLKINLQPQYKSDSFCPVSSPACNRQPWMSNWMLIICYTPSRIIDICF